MNNSVLTKRRGKVLEITLDRPKVNAIDVATSRKLGEVFSAFRDDKDLLVATITGGGEHIFSAGWDLKAAAQHGEHEGMDYGIGGFAGLTEFFDLDKPVIAAVNGIAIGGGVELALACDLIVAVEGASFSLPETTLGVAADGGGLQRLPRKIPANIAMDMLLTGRKMEMEEAAHYGLVNYVVPRDRLTERVRELAGSIAEGAPLAVRAIKEVMRGIDGLTTEDAFATVKTRSFPVYDAMLDSEDHLEGPRAFNEKRKPVWKGR